MLKKPRSSISKSLLAKTISIVSLAIPIYYFNTINEVKSGIEFQWDGNTNFKKLKWFQTDSGRSARNTTYFFLRPSDRKSGLLKIDIKFPKRFQTNLKKEKINLCRVHIGGFDSRTKCLENIAADFEINKEDNKTNLNIYPLRPIPSSRDSYAVVVKSFNPGRSGLYQVHSYGQASGNIPVSSYLGSWTIVID